MQGGSGGWWQGQLEMVHWKGGRKNESGSRGDERSVLLKEAENCSLAGFYRHKSYFCMFYADRIDNIRRVWSSGDSSELDIEV